MPAFKQMKLDRFFQSRSARDLPGRCGLFCMNSTDFPSTLLTPKNCNTLS